MDTTIVPDLRGRIADALAAKPLDLKGLTTAVGKNYPTSTKKVPAPPKPTEAEVEETLRDMMRDGAAFALPGKKGPTYSAEAPPDPAEVVSKAVRAAVETLGDDAVKADKLFKAKTAEEKQALADVLRELEGEGKLFPQAKKDHYGRTKPQTAAERVGAAVAAKLATMPEKGTFKPNELFKAGKDDKAALAEVLAGLVAAGKLFVHGKDTYGRTKPQTAAERVGAAVAAKLATMSNLGTFKSGDLFKAKGDEEKSALAAELARLVAAGKLFEYGKDRYGLSAPRVPPWYETKPHAADFTKALTAAKKILDGGISADDLLAALRQHLTPGTMPETTTVAVVQTPEESRPITTEPVKADLRTVLRESYDHLCRFVEFRDKLVEIRRLWHEASKRMPGLTLEAFHRELWQMRSEWLVELHVLNEVHSAKEPELAINHDDRLYYFILWK